MNSQAGFAEFGFWSCVALCTRTNYKFVSPAGQGCRITPDCALSFAGYELKYFTACGVADSDFKGWSSSVVYIPVRFQDFESCTNYGEVVRAAETQLSSKGPALEQSSTSTAVAAEDAACSCNSIVHTILEAFVEKNVPKSGSPTDMCTFVIDSIVPKLDDKVLPLCKQASGVAKMVCDLAFGAIDAVEASIKGKIIPLCAAVLQTVLDVLKLSDTVQNLIAAINGAANQIINDASRFFCGATVCTSAQQSSCQAQPVNGVNALVTLLNNNQGLCKFVSYTIGAAAEGSGCFPGTSMLLQCDGKQLALADARVGSKIQTASGACSEIFYFATRDAGVIVQIIRIDAVVVPLQHGNLMLLPSQGTATGSPAIFTHSLRVHRSNLVPLATGERVPAGLIQTGHLLQAAGGRIISVARVSVEQGIGLHHPHLASLEDYAVDGVLVSQFTEAGHPIYGPMYGMAGLRVLRTLYIMGIQVDTDAIRAGAKTLAGAFAVVFSLFSPAPVVFVPEFAVANSTA